MVALILHLLALDMEVMGSSLNQAFRRQAMGLLSQVMDLDRPHQPLEQHQAMGNNQRGQEDTNLRSLAILPPERKVTQPQA